MKERQVILHSAIRVAFLGLLIILGSQCASRKASPSSDYHDYYERGEKNFEKKKWEKAIENFNMVLLNSPGGELADDAQFYLGECYYNKKEYLLAISEYQQLTERYSYSPLAEEAYYKIALSYFELSPKYQLDQEYSYKALTEFQEFIETYAGSDWRLDAEEKIEEIRNRLAHKLYAAGKLYRKLHQWDSAIIYFENMLESYYDTKWITPAKLEMAHCYIKMRDFNKYKSIVLELNNNKPKPETKEQLAYLASLYRKEMEKLKKEQNRPN